MAFFELIKKRRKTCEEPLSEGSEGLLKDALSQLITYHQDFRSLLYESSILNKTESKGGKNTSLTHDHPRGGNWVRLCPTFLCQESATLGRDVSYHSAETCAAEFLQLIKSDGNDKTHKLDTLMKVMKQMIQEHQFNTDHFVGIICKQSNFPLEWLWQLHREDICSVERFLSMKLSDAGFVERTSEQLATLLRVKIDDPNSLFVSGLIGCLVNIGFSENKRETATRKVAVSVLDNVTKKLLNEQSCDTEVLFPICVVCDNVTVLMTTLKNFSTHCLAVMMGHNPVYKVSRAIRDQVQWTFAKISNSLRQCFKQILLLFEPHEVIAALQHILDIQEVNWQMVLSFTSVLLICIPQAPRLLEDYVMVLLKEGLDNTDMEKTITGFLFARQACYEGPHVFRNYQDWFQQVFVESAKSPANTRKSFTFLMKFLTDLVPFESAHHLKVHILRPPHAAPKCRELLMDYIDLAKTRLTDLKESVDNADLHEDKQKQTDKVEADLEKAVATFGCTNKIPSSVMEASIFRKPYYIGRFIPVLLKPRPLPDIPDTKMKFIEALKRSEKIPDVLYTKYEKACLSEATQLLEGVFMETSEEDTMADVDLEPMEQLEFRLEQLSQAVIEHATPSDTKNRVPDLLSLTREKLSLLLPDPKKVITDTRRTSKCIVISDTRADVPTVHSQIVEHVVKFYSKTVATLMKMETVSFGWALQFSAILAEFTPIHRSLLSCIWELVTKKGHHLDDNQMFGLAAICSSLEGQQEKFDDVHIRDSFLLKLRKEPMPFLSALWLSLPSCHSHGMTFSLRFMNYSLNFALSMYGKDVYPSMITPGYVTQFFYLCTRIVPGIGYSSPARHVPICEADLCEARQLFTCDSYQQSLLKHQVMFSDWISLEIHVNSEDDLLTVFDRQEYYLWVIYTHFMDQCQQKPKEMCSDLIQTIMEADLSCKSPVPEMTYSSKNGRSLLRTTPSNRNSVLSLLQQLVGFLSENDVDDDLWLLKEFESLLAKQNQFEDSCIHSQWAITCFFRTVLVLPPFLFYTNSPGKICASSLKKLSIFVNQYMVQCCTEGCQLPLHLTAYLIQGLQQILPHLHMSDWSSVNNFLSSCPVIILSLIVHIRKLKHFVQMWRPYQNSSNILKCFLDVSDWIERCESISSSESAEWEPMWMYAAGIYSLTAQGLDNFKMSVPQLSRSAVKIKKISQVLLMFGDFLCCQLTTTDLGQVKIVGDLLWQLLTSYPPTLDHLTNSNSNQTFLMKLASPACLKQRYVSLLEFLKGRSQRSLLQIEKSVFSIVNLFAKICQQFEELQGGDGDSKPLTMKTLCEFSTFVKSCISNSSVNQLCHIDEDAVKMCGTDVVAILHQRRKQLQQ